MSTDQCLIDKIDEGLCDYYLKLGRKDYINEQGIGKFRYFVDESGFEDDGIEEELEQNADECTIVEFDMDDDDNNMFPLEEEIEDEDAKNIEIHRILNDIAKYGTPQTDDTMELSIEICTNLKQDEFNKFTSKYTSEMSSLKTVQGKDNDLKWFLAIGKKQKYPFLAYMVDSFTKEKAEHHFKTSHNDNNSQPLTVATWTQKNKFFNALRRKYPGKATQLRAAMVNYCNRIMNRLQFEPTFKISDNIRDIIEYVVAVPRFIKNILFARSKAIPPFQVDLLIAVNQVIPTVIDSNVDDDDQDQDEEDDTKIDTSMKPDIDHIGFVQQHFKKLIPPIYYAPSNDKYEIIEEKNDRMGGITRILGERYQDFRTILSGNSVDEVKYNSIYDHDGKKSRNFNAKTYPSLRRFSVFIDRRANKPTKCKEDEMTIFEPPFDCNLMGKDHVPEIGFEFLRTCILPRKGTPHVIATDSLCGQLITFMFNVEAQDEMKCYIVWNGQTMRFHGDHISKILPNIFVESVENNKFVKSKEQRNLEREFEQCVHDRKFVKFYKALKNFEPIY